MPDMVRGTDASSLWDISTEGRGQIVAVTVTEEQQANVDGNAYNINTGVITLTNAADTPVLYVKNNETNDMIVSAIAVGFGASDGTAGDPNTITIIRNPKTGTIITDTPTDVDMNQNRNYGSPNTLTNVLAYKGATGDTMTDGEDIIKIFQTESGRAFAALNEVLPKGTSIGVKIEPPDSNTSEKCYAALVVHLRNPNL